MFRTVGQTVSRFWPLMLVVWALIYVGSLTLSPDWMDVTQDGEFVFLPEDSPSRVAEELYRRAFPAKASMAATADGDVDEADDRADRENASVQQNPLGSTVIVLVRRVDQADGLTDVDKSWVEEVLVPKLEAVAQSTGRGYIKPDGETFTPHENADETVVQGIWSLGDRKIGPMLTSPDNKATIVALELKTEFLDRSNALFIEKMETLLADITDGIKHPELKVPIGLDIAISGSATVGRDMLFNEESSAAKTELFTKVLVIFLLLIIYRAPLLALIPLITVGLSVEVTIYLLRILAGWGVVGLFNGIEVYVTVVVYGAGVDYCLFLIARYKEELDNGHTLTEAISTSIQNVGVALATSAGTSICGIGMMGFAEFGKFQQAGIAISFGLLVALCASLTFTPALLVMCGRWAFWPDMREETIAPDAEIAPRFSLLSLLQEQQVLDRAWQKVADIVFARPATVFLVAVALMTPFAVVAVKYHTFLSYGLLTDLPQDDPSVVGAMAVQRHFAAGIAGPTTILLYHPDLNLPVGADGTREGEQFADALTEQLRGRMDEMQLADIRTQKHPLGTTDIAESYVQSQQRRGPLRANAMRNMARQTYVSQEGELAGDVIRVDLIFNVDPFMKNSINLLTNVETAVRDALPVAYAAVLSDRAEAAAFEADFEDIDENEAASDAANNDVSGDDLLTDDSSGIVPLFDDGSPRITDAARKMADQTTIASIGSTAGIRDLKSVTDSDQVRIYMLVVFSVYIVLVALLRKPAICGYLLLSVVFSYLVTLGVTFVFFWSLDTGEFAGLDWKVPIFLFTILIAMGEDYNILLMARVEEEQQTHKPVKGVLVALAKTGSIISSCGIIMAGTFSSLAMGTLLGMTQLGFALAFGVLLDTFVVRPILVPAYLVMLHSGRFGKLGPWLGSQAHIENAPATEA